jgi:predicted ATP-dependent serine protease
VSSYYCGQCGVEIFSPGLCYNCESHRKLIEQNSSRAASAAEEHAASTSALLDMEHERAEREEQEREEKEGSRSLVTTTSF